MFVCLCEYVCICVTEAWFELQPQERTRKWASFQRCTCVCLPVCMSIRVCVCVCVCVCDESLTLVTVTTKKLEKVAFMSIIYLCVYDACVGVWVCMCGGRPVRVVSCVHTCMRISCNFRQFECAYVSVCVFTIFLLLYAFAYVCLCVYLRLYCFLCNTGSDHWCEDAYLHTCMNILTYYAINLLLLQARPIRLG